MFKGITRWLYVSDLIQVALLAVTVLATAGAASFPAQAFDEDDLKRLIETGECPGCDLRGSDLRRLDLTGANLAAANLENANFFYAILDRADLTDANLRATNFSYGRAIGADLTGADFEEAL